MNNYIKSYLKARNVNKRKEKLNTILVNMINIFFGLLIGCLLAYFLYIINDMHKIALCYAFNDTPNSVINCFFN